MSRYLSICVLVAIWWGGDTIRSVNADEGEGIEGLAEAIPLLGKASQNGEFGDPRSS